MSLTPAKKFRAALSKESPLQIVGCINAYCALLAKNAGFKAIYLSGAGVANASYGLPDLGVTSLQDVLIDVRRITNRVDTPLLVDVDTGWGTALTIARTVKELIQAGAAAMHIEDQVVAKRCGHRPNKAIVSSSEMVDRIKAAVDARSENDFIIMARTDAFAQEGMNAAIDRAHACLEAGADMIFPEALTELSQYQQFSESVKAPILANITEFGQTPLFSTQDLKAVNVAMALYPLSAFRAMSQSAENTYQCIREQGSQQAFIDRMQTRDELYKTLDYHQFEAIIDKLNKEGE